jgi:hypothetical protein
MLLSQPRFPQSSSEDLSTRISVPSLRETLGLDIEKGSSGRGDLFSISRYKAVYYGENSREADIYLK